MGQPHFRGLGSLIRVYRSKYRNPGFDARSPGSPAQTHPSFGFLRDSVAPWCKGLVFGFDFCLVNTLPSLCVYDHRRGSAIMASTFGDGADLPIASMELHAVRGSADNEAAEDARLVTAARSGDRAAFGRLYDRFAPMVHGILLSGTRASRIPWTIGEVDDLVHDVFLHAMPRLHSLR